MSQKAPQPHRSNWAAALGLGTELAVSVGLGVFVGWWLDGKWDTAPALTVVGALAGMALGFYQLIRFTRTLGGRG